MQLHLHAIEDKGKKIGLRNVYSAYGKIIEQEIVNIDLENTIAPVYCTLQVFSDGAIEFRIVEPIKVDTCPETS